MRADRLLSILMLLQTKGRMTAHDLAEQLEVSERTIYRDLEALGMAGVPVYTERGPGGGCELVDGYQTRLTGLTEAEVRALFLLTMTGPLADLGLGEVLEDALLKLTAALPAPSRHQATQVRQRFHVDAAWWYHQADATNILQVIQQAVWQDRKLRLLYCEDDGSRSEQTIEPYGLVAKASIWYLVAARQNTFAVYRVSRIQSAVATEEPFVRAADFDLAEYWAEYCALSESAYPQYAVPLRLPPDEVPTFPQTLNTWGYQLVEYDEALETVAYATPGQEQPQKKGVDIHSTEASPFSVQATHQLYVLDRNGKWQVVNRYGREKKAVMNMSGTSKPIKKSISNSATRQKKRAFLPLKKRNFAVASRSRQQNKKNDASGLSKKTRLSSKTASSPANKKNEIFCSTSFSLSA